MCCNETEDAYSFIFNAIKTSVSSIYDYDFQPTCLIADAADAITNGFENVFLELLRRVMCWFHMKKAYEDHPTFKIIKSPNKEHIMQDINTLQLSESTEIFEAAYELFKDKWLHKTDAIDNFINTYFEAEWIQKHPGWYEGYAPGIPSTNNALESTNRVVKDEGTYRVKLPLGRFLEVVKVDIIEKWSRDRDTSKPFSKTFIEKPEINHALWVQGFHLNIDDRPTATISNKNVKSTFMSTGRVNGDGDAIIDRSNIQKEIKLYRNAKTNKNWKDFEQYTDYQTRLWQLSFYEDKNEWQSKSTCTCSSFQKNYICKHILLQAIRFNYVDVPLTAQTVELEDKPKRGRPKTISKALQIDPPVLKTKRQINDVEVETTNKKRRLAKKN